VAAARRAVEVETTKGWRLCDLRKVVKDENSSYLYYRHTREENGLESQDYQIEAKNVDFALIKYLIQIFYGTLTGFLA